LTPGTTYHFRVNAGYTGGTTHGSDLTFTTSAPSATTAAATGITLSAATLNGSVNDNGVAITSVTFDYGLTAAYGTTIAATPSSVSAGAGATSVAGAISGLSPNTTYHFRVNAAYTGGGGITNGSDMTFTTYAYTLTYTPGTNGSITGVLAQMVVSNGSGTTVTAVPATGYHFVNWSDAVATAARTDTNVTNNISVTANFAINTYTLTYTPGAHGSISGITPQTVNYGAAGSTVTAVPATGYHFVNWSDAVATAVRTDTNVTNSISVTANFAINTYTLTYTAGAHGSISGTTPQTVNYGASGTVVTAVPATGYSFVSWSDGFASASRIDNNVSTNVSVTANFTINNYTLTYIAGANGSITGVLFQSVNFGASGTSVTAVPSAGYHFVSWSDGNTAATRIDANVIANISVTASFAVNAYTLTYTAGANGSVTGTSPQTVNNGASGTAVTAVPSVGYHFASWSDGNTNAARTDTNVTGNISVTASFAVNTNTLTYTAGANGSISGTSPQTVNTGASGTTVTAVPAAGFHFVNWSDGNTTAARTDTNVTSNISVTAAFAVNTYTLTYTAGANGSITGTSPQTVNNGAAGTTVTAVPAAGYHFVSWSDGNTTAARTDTGVTANISVTAGFTINAAPAPVTGVGSVNVAGIVDTSGKFETSATVTSSDTDASVKIDAGTTATSSGSSISTITVTAQTNPPAPPAGSNIIGIGYDFGPSGSHFTPPVHITIHYNPADIPAGVPETSLVIGYYNTTTGNWDTVSGGLVDTTAHTITISVDHWTLFSVMAAAAATTTASGGLGGGLIAVIVVIAVIVIAVLFWLLVMRRKRK
jgi:hypothetical protein